MNQPGGPEGESPSAQREGSPATGRSGGIGKAGAEGTGENRFAAWLGATDETTDFIAPAPARQAAALYDWAADGTVPVFDTGAELPPLWHWFYFLSLAPQSKLGEDGHPQRGGFMPPIDLPRRMFAGSRLKFVQPLRIGAPAKRVLTIRAISEKSGRTGRLGFVTVGSLITQDGATCIEEEQDIVYREPGAPIAAPAVRAAPPAPPGAYSRTVTPDTRMLFRFSALTYNAHRIHYDRPYAREVEGYPGLIVHGPLIATLLLDLVRRHVDQRVAAFEFRAQAPVLDLAPFHLVGEPGADGKIALQAIGADGAVAMKATAQLA